MHSGVQQLPTSILVDLRSTPHDNENHAGSRLSVDSHQSRAQTSRPLQFSILTANEKAVTQEAVTSGRNGTKCTGLISKLEVSHDHALRSQGMRPVGLRRRQQVSGSKDGKLDDATKTAMSSLKSIPPGCKLQQHAAQTRQHHDKPKRNSKPLPTGSTQQTAKSSVTEQLFYDKISADPDLLHLHMVHRAATETAAQWKESAKQIHRRHFESLVAVLRNINLQKNEFQEQVNASALIHWCRGTESTVAKSPIKTLSILLAEVEDLSRPDGKHSRTIQMFEHWYDQVSRTRQSRPKSKTGLENPVQSLSDRWKAEARELKNDLHHLQQEYQMLDIPPGNSDLGRCLSAIDMQIKMMLEELDSISSIEELMVNQY